MEKQFLINQFKLDKHLLFLIKDYTFETICERDKVRRYKERNNSYLHERINVKTYIFEMGERNEIIEMPNAFYRNIDNAYDKIVSHLNECWLAVEEEIVFLWNKYAVQRKNTRDNEIEYLLLNASIYDERCLNQCRSDILIHVDEFDIELVSFKESYFMCVEGRDIYMPFF